jgi:hypothetical protein
VKCFTADFETTTDLADCRVWAYALCEIGNTDNFLYGNNIKSFIDFCKNKKENYRLYFHNLKFDGEYIFSYLLNNGFELITDKKEKRDNTFTCLISDTGQFYSIEIYFTVKKKKVNKVTIYDSLKILNFSVDKIAKAFNLPIRKLTLDYKAYREIGHELTTDEVNYIRNDVEIMARALKYMFDEGLNKMTIGSDALSDYKSRCKYFKKYYPILPYEIDHDIRESYKGGFTYLNDCYKGKETGEGVVLDVNSLYPSCMRNEILPFGEPIFFEGEYKENKLYPLYVQKFTCIFDIKPNKIPSIQLKNNMSFMPNEYIKSSNGDLVTLTLTNIDLDLFFTQYNVKNIIYHSGWMFKGVRGLFTEYIDYWTERKIQAKKDNNNVTYLISKLMLNSLYGKFGLNPNVRGKYPYLDEDGVVKYMLSPLERRDPIYIPTATFITSYARRKTILTSQSIKDFSIDNFGVDYYIYSDTDSIHLLKMDEELLKQFVDIDDYRIGAWKLESTFSRSKYLRQKCYIEENEDKINVTVAGLPKNLGKYINFENFNQGLLLSIDNQDIDHKLTFKHVKGGVLLVDTDFTIK